MFLIFLKPTQQRVLGIPASVSGMVTSFWCGHKRRKLGLAGFLEALKGLHDSHPQNSAKQPSGKPFE